MYTLENTPFRGEEGKISADGIWAKKYEKRREQKGYYERKGQRRNISVKYLLRHHFHGMDPMLN
jgi:hypothetical protein